MSFFKRRPVWITAVAVLVVACLGAVGVFVYNTALTADRAAARFAAQMQSGDIDARDLVAGDAQAKTVRDALAGLRKVASVRVVSVGVDSADSGRATAHLDWTWNVNGAKATGKQWNYTTKLALEKRGVRWRTDPDPAALAPELTAGARLEVRKQATPRGRVLGAGDTVLMKDGEVVEVGVQPSRVKDVKSVTKTLARTLDIDGDALAKRIKAAQGTKTADQFMSVITLRRGAYEKVSSIIKPLPGTLFKTATQSLAVDKDLARPVLGSVGQASAEQIKDARGALAAGDLAGFSGIQKSYDATLRGTAGYDVVVTGGEERDGTTVGELGNAAGTDVHTTLDLKIQRAADRVATAAAKKAKRAVAIVALRPSDGHVLAAANAAGKDGSLYDRALTGRYAPGSTFKIVTSAGLIAKGWGQDKKMPCPASATVNGKAFKNAEGHVQGEPTFREDFAQSCNTAFVRAAGQLDAGALPAIATSTGMTGPDIGIPAFGASVPAAQAPEERAASAIGQGKVLASPLGVATLAAAVQHGKRVDPVLVTGKASTASPAESATETPTGSGDGAITGLDAKGLAELRAMMRRTVTDGTATALKGVPGRPVYGKTGTAEYGSANPPRTHAWFAGYQGDLALAVLVEDGGFGAKAAVPVAKDFLSAIN